MIPHLSCKKNSLFPRISPTHAPRQGFAIIVTLAMMAFLLLLMLTLSTLLQVSTLNEELASRRAAAQENAMLALNVALGQLQRYAGPDQRVSARADINALNVGNPRWIGIWDATGTELTPDSPADDPNLTHSVAPTSTEPMIWLVSGSDNTTDPLNPVNPAVDDPDGVNGNVWLRRKVLGEDLPVNEQIKLATTPVYKANSTTQTGSYAYWVDDESLKAQITLDNPSFDALAGSEEQVRQLTAAPRPGVEQMTGFETVFSPVFTKDATSQDASFRNGLGVVSSLPDLTLLSSSGGTLTNDAVRANYTDITVGSYGVLADTLHGGLRRDLTRGLDPTLTTDFDTDADLAPEIGSNTSVFTMPTPGPVGKTSSLTSFTSAWTELPAPTWEDIRAFTQIRVGDDQQMDPVFCPIVGKSPNGQSVLPIVVLIDLGYGVDLSKSTYHYSMEPVVVLMNPYNVFLNEADYVVEFNQPRKPPKNGNSPVYAPGVIFGYKESSGQKNFSYLDALEFYKVIGSNQLYFNIKDSFKPGEVKIYTLAQDIVLDNSAGGVINLSPGYTEAAVLMDTGVPIGGIVGEGSTGHFRMTGINATHPTIKLRPGPMPPGSGPLPESSMVNWIQVDSKEIFFNDNRLQPVAYFSSGTARGLGYFQYFLVHANDDVNTVGSVITDGVPADHPSMHGGKPQGDSSGIRYLIDSNPRAPTILPVAGWYGNANYRFSNSNKTGHERDYLNDNAFWGADLTSIDGSSTVALFDILRQDEELVSIGQLSNVNWGPDGKHPAYPLGNSYASIFYEADSPDFGYTVNEALWDKFFFSTLPEELATRPDRLPNSRLIYYDFETSGTDMSTLEGIAGYTEAASRLLINGAFNINSTSIEAWTAFLGSIPTSEYKHSDLKGITENNSDSRPYLRLRHVHDADPTQSQYHSYEWSGYRNLSDDQIEQIATKIVEGIQARGRPARSLAEFMNRDLSFPSDDIRNQKGIVQAAIDNVMNQDAPNEVDGSNLGKKELANLPGLLPDVVVTKGDGNQKGLINASNPDAAAGKLRTTGAPGFLMQSDLITPLAPAMTARSDTFYVRAYGNHRNPVTGQIDAQAWCEAYFQRLPEFIGGEAPATRLDDLTTGEASDIFGRGFVMTHFRWLSEEEI